MNLCQLGRGAWAMGLARVSGRGRSSDLGLFSCQGGQLGQHIGRLSQALPFVIVHHSHPMTFGVAGKHAYFGARSSSNIGEITTTLSDPTVHWAIAHRRRQWSRRGREKEHWQAAEWPLRLTQELNQLMRTGQPSARPIARPTVRDRHGTTACASGHGQRRQ